MRLLKMTSEEIASLTGESHDILLRDIAGVEGMWRAVFGAEFERSESGGYLLNKEETLYATVNYSNRIRAKIIETWRKFEDEKAYTLPSDYESALEQLLDQVKANRMSKLADKVLGEMRKEITDDINDLFPVESEVVEEDKPARVVLKEGVSKYREDILKRKNCRYSTREIASEYNLSAQALNNKLKALGIIYKPNGAQAWKLCVEYQGKGYVEVIPTGHKDYMISPKWTPMGRAFIYDVLKENGILPWKEKGI